MIFPTVSGENLTGRSYIIPYSLEGEYNLVMIAFEPAQQFLMRTWLSLLSQLAVKYNNFRYYELPILDSSLLDQRMNNDRSMRRSILDPDIRDIVITLYLDKTAFSESLKLRGENTIHLLLIDHEGVILWRNEGIATQSKKDDLTQTVQRIFETQDTFPWEI